MSFLDSYNLMVPIRRNRINTFSKKTGSRVASTDSLETVQENQGESQNYTSV